MKQFATHPLTVSRDEILLALEGVHAGYGTSAVLHGVSFDIAVNEVVALFGDNGAGKSTVLRVIGGLLSPTAGRVVFQQQPICGLLPHIIQQRKIGYLLQGGRVFPNLTVRQNLELSQRNAAGEPSDHRNSRELFSALKDRGNVRAGLLSGGERQMLAIELVLTQNPSLLLLDEPTAGLAPALIFEVMRRIREFAAMPGHAVLLIEQEPNTAKLAASRSLTLQNGVVTSAWDEASELNHCNPYTQGTIT